MSYGSKKSGYGSSSQNSSNYNSEDNSNYLKSSSSIPMFKGGNLNSGSCKGTCYTDIGCTCGRQKR